MEEQKPVLIVFNAGGDHTFLGRLDKPGVEIPPDLDDSYIIEAFEERVLNGKMTNIFDCFPIGKQPVMGPQGPMHVPALGTIAWCVLEPIRKMVVMPKWYFFPAAQGEESQSEFHRTYSEFMQELEAAKAQHAMEKANISKASPADLKRMEESAKKLGLGTGPDLLQALKSGGKLIK